jgi:hypothetical protein
MSQTTFESLLYTVRDVGFPGYDEENDFQTAELLWEMTL